MRISSFMMTTPQTTIRAPFLSFEDLATIEAASGGDLLTKRQLIVRAQADPSFVGQLRAVAADYMSDRRARLRGF